MLFRRVRLTQYSLAERTYRRLVKTMAQNNLANFSIGSEIGPSAPAVFKRKSGRPLTDGINGLYTYRGYHELFAPEVDRVVRYVGDNDAWVLGSSQLSAGELALAVANGSLTLEVKKLYMWDYVKIWDAFIGDIDLIRPTSLTQAAELTKRLSSVDSPMARLMKAMATETTLLKPDAPGSSSDASLLARARRTATSTQNDVARLIGPSSLAALGMAAQEQPERIVDKHFEALRDSVGTKEAPGPLMGTLQALSELHLLVSAVEAARAGGTPLPPVGGLPTSLKAQASHLPLPGKPLIESLVNVSDTLIKRAQNTVRSSQIAGTITPVCKQTIEGRYPFRVTASREVGSEDFSRMFAPGGILDAYFQRELAPITNTSTSPWRLIPGAQGGQGAGARALAQFERAAVIKDVFFRSGGGAPAVSILLKPLEMDTSITQMHLDIDGQVIRYQHGPQVGRTVRWPGPGGSHQVRLSLEPALGGGADGLVLEGPWALHRLFDRARITPGASPERFRASLDIGGRRVHFEVIAGSVKNPFALQEMRTFACPAGL